jgi:hypothetical protein
MKGPSIDGSNLRLKQRGHEERVLSEFNGFNTSVLGAGSDREPVGDESLNIDRRETKIAPMKSGEGLTAANVVHSSSWNGSHGALLRDETADQSIDHQRPVAGSRFGVIGLNEAGHIAGELDGRVLKPTTRPHEWLP